MRHSFVFPFVKFVAAAGVAALIFGASAQVTLGLIAQQAAKASAVTAASVTYAERRTMPEVVALVETLPVPAPAIIPAIEPPAPTAAVAAEPMMSVTVSSLAVRSKPKKASNMVASIVEGEEVAALDKNGSWVLVRTKSGEIGWAFGKYLSPLGSTAAN